MENQFKGIITEISTPRTGSGAKGEWAKVEFEVTELNPQNPDYPQVASFDFFKNGEYLKYAKEFETFYPLKTVVTVDFNFKKNEYTKKDGTAARFYKTSAWKIEKADTELAPFTPPTVLEKEDDLPF